jgi:thiamine biosynthesis lipoprotein ApbE
MKKVIVFVTLLLVVISGCSCKKDQRAAIFSSYVVGYKNIEDIHGVFVEPFGSYISLVNYNKKKLDKVKGVFDEAVFKYHSLFDRNYYYKDRQGNLINNVKVINDSYGSENYIMVDKELVNILLEGIKYSKLSNGKFNILAGSIIDLWDERFSSKDETIRYVDPSEEDILKAMKCVVDVNDIDSVLYVDKEHSSVKFNSIEGCDGKASIALGALAKSYFLDKMVENNVFKDIGASIFDGGQSSIIVRGDNPVREGGFFNIAIKNNLRGGQALQIFLKNRAMSTSSINNRNYVNQFGDVRHHIINGVSGYPSTYLLSATAVGDSAMVADIVTTTLMCMDSLDEIKSYLLLLENQGVKLDVLLQVKENDNLKVLVNSSMRFIITNVSDNGVNVEEFSYGIEA